jgi:hypothetical protein
MLSQASLALNLVWICLLFMWLEAIIGYCAGCKLYAILAHAGLVNRHCEACDNINARNSSYSAALGASVVFLYCVPIPVIAASRLRSITTSTKTLLTYTTQLQEWPKTLSWQYNKDYGDSALRYQVFEKNEYNNKARDFNSLGI